MTAPRMTVAALLLTAALAAWAQDAARGKELYETHCGGCHYQRVHERDRTRSRVQSLAQLRAEVARWAQQVNRPFTLEDLDDLAEYLERSHYRFDK